MKTSKQGMPLRFGAMATLDGAQTISGIIDDDGSLYMSGLPGEGNDNCTLGRRSRSNLSYQLRAYRTTN